MGFNSAFKGLMTFFLPLRKESHFTWKLIGNIKPSGDLVFSVVLSCNLADIL